MKNKSTINNKKIYRGFNTYDSKLQTPEPRTFSFSSSPAPKEGAAVTGRLDEKGLIMPKKLVNPNMESTEKKSLHRELMYNQKR